MGNLYEGLLEKNANEKKSGAGQYFTPRVLIDVMTRLVKPQPGERCNDPACGTFGFMISASQYVRENTDDLFELDADTAKFEREEAFSGCELVHDTHRLALMNAMLHDIEGEIKLADTLSNAGKEMKGYDVVLTNPPFGTKKGGERATRDDFTFPTSNKQLNFLQHIYRSLNTDGKARAAVVLPDNVLFADGDGERIRKDLMEKCNLHTILRLPIGMLALRPPQRCMKKGCAWRNIWQKGRQSNKSALPAFCLHKHTYFRDFVGICSNLVFTSRRCVYCPNLMLMRGSQS